MRTVEVAQALVTTLTKTVNLTNIKQEWTFLLIRDENELTLEGANEIGIRDKNATRRCALTNSYWYWQLQKGEYQSSTAYLYCRWTSTSSLPTGQEGQTAAIYKRLGYYVSNNRTIKLLLPKDLESSE